MIQKNFSINISFIVGRRFLRTFPSCYMAKWILNRQFAKIDESCRPYSLLQQSSIETIPDTTSGQLTPLQKRPQVWFELPEEIPPALELLMKMLPENAKIKKIYRGTLLLVYIYSKNLISLINKIFQQNFKWPSVLTPIRWICWKITKNLIFNHILVKYDLKSKHQ